MTDGQNTTTEYVVVGAGSAGSVVTRRLLDAGFSVHVLEAGLVDTDANIHPPQGWPALLGGPQGLGRDDSAAEARQPPLVVLAAREGAKRQQFSERNDLHPTVPAGNTNAPSIMIGAKDSDLLLDGACA